MTGRFHEFRYYSPLHDCEMVRLSVFNERDAEFFMLIPASSPKRYRERRDTALNHIDYAIEHGLEPGRVKVKEAV